MEWLRMRELWQLVDRYAPSQTALRGAWSEVVERREAWQGADGTWLDGGEAAWLDLARAVFHERLGVRGACLGVGGGRRRRPTGLEPGVAHKRIEKASFRR